MHETAPEVSVSRADIIDAIYSSPESRLKLEDLERRVLEKLAVNPADEAGTRNAEVGFTWTYRAMVKDGMIGFDGEGHLRIIASLEQLRDYYPPANEPCFRLKPA